MLKPKYLFSFLVVLCIGLLVAVGEVKAGFPERIIDDFDREVMINKKPGRVVSLSPTNTEILFAIGAGDKVVGVTKYCDFPPRVEKIDKVGGYSTPNIEAIVAKKPDLVVASYGNGEENIKRLKELGINVVALHPKSLRDVLKDIKLVGRATGSERKAIQLIQQLQERINQIKEKSARIPEEERPRVLWLMWYPELWTAGGGTFFHELVNLAGGKNIARNLKGWKMISKEVVLARDPQIIFCSRMGEKEGFLHKVLEDPQLNQTEAVKGGWIYQLKQNIIERPGPRIVDGLEEISHYVQKWWEKKQETKGKR